MTHTDKLKYHGLIDFSQTQWFKKVVSIGEEIDIWVYHLPLRTQKVIEKHQRLKFYVSMDTLAVRVKQFETVSFTFFFWDLYARFYLIGFVL